MKSRIGKGLLGGAAIISVITVFARLMGFARWAVFAPTLGSTATGTAYNTANQLPTSLFDIVAGGTLAAAVVPLMAGALVERRIQHVSDVASAFFTWAVTLLVPLGAILALCAKPIADAMIPQSAPPGTRHLVAVLILCFAPQVPLYGVGVLLSGVLQAGKRFTWPALAPLLSSLAVIVVYSLFGYFAQGDQNRPAELGMGAIMWLGWGTTFGVVMLSLPQIVPVLRSGVRLRWTYRFPPGVAKKAFSLSSASIFGVLAQEASVLVIIALANHYGSTGALSVYNYAQAVYLLPYAVLIVPLSISAYPRLAHAAERGDMEWHARGTAATTRSILGASTIGAVALLAAAPAVERVFAGLDRTRDAYGLGGALTLFAPALLGYGLVAHLTRVLFTTGRARAAAIATSSGWIAVIAVSIIAVNAFTHDNVKNSTTTLRGLGLGLLVGMSLAGLLLLIQVRRVMGRESLAGLTRTFIVLGVFGVAGGFCGRAVTMSFHFHRGGTAIAAGVAGGVVAVAIVAIGIIVFDRSLIDALRIGEDPNTLEAE